MPGTKLENAYMLKLLPTTLPVFISSSRSFRTYQNVSKDVRDRWIEVPDNSFNRVWPPKSIRLRLAIMAKKYYRLQIHLGALFGKLANKRLIPAIYHAHKAVFDGSLELFLPRKVARW